MVAPNSVLDALKGIGLNLYERLIYTALLAKGIATAGEVSEIAKVPRSRSYDVLESLAEKGFVIVQPAKPIKYVALAPRDALERTKENTKRKHNETLERIEKMKSSSVMNELEKLHKDGFNLVQPFDMTGTLKGRHSINQQLQQIFKQAKESMNILTTGEGLSDLYSNHFNTLKKANRGGVKIRILAPLGSNKPSKDFSQIAETRHLDNELGRMYTVDNGHVVMALTDDKETHHTQDTAFWANSSHIARSIVEPLFNSIWDSAK